MSLRATLILWIGLVLLASLLVGSVLVYWNAVQKVDVEMRAAITVGEHTIHNAIDDAEEAAAPLRQMRLLVGDLDGDRHLRATLTDAKGVILARSMPLQATEPAPRWFYNLLAPQPQIDRMQLPSAQSPLGVLTLETDSHNEISEVWSDVILTLTVLSLFCLLNALLVFWVTGRALQPLNDVIRTFDRIGSGDYPRQLPGRGPAEMRRLSQGVNQMVHKLSDMENRKHRLEEQLVAVQEEERSQLAQDLHDEVGPLLFAVSVDLTALQDHQSVCADPQTWARLVALRDAVSRIQRHVKTILLQLRPPSVADLGLAHSIEGMAAFWRARYPNVAFRIKVAADSFSPEINSRIARIVQESISNALRHGQPSSIEIEVLTDPDGAVVARICDDGAGLQSDGNPTGLGLRGMRDRVDSLGGVLTMSSGPDGQGVIISARFPAPEQVA